MAKVGVVLSGCGFLDGSEIHEATLTLYFLDKAGAEIKCMSLDTLQSDVVDHLKKESIGQERNVLAEAARIARGDIKNIDSSGLDALIFPGGFGAAKNLSNFGSQGVDCKVNPEVESLIQALYEQNKPMGFICIAPVLAAKVLGKYGPTLTVGNDTDTAGALMKMGAKHQECPVNEIVVDKDKKIVSTPAYMLGPTISKVAVGIEKLVDKVLELI
tara:strand:+ start:206 stop:850 length:645 start_codon:yes stop_codon:yes gene_type:complete